MPSRLAPCTETHAHSPGRVEPRHRRGVVTQDLAADGRRDPAHYVVACRIDGHELLHRIDAQVGAGEFGDVGQFGVEHVFTEVPNVDVHVVLVRPGAASFEDFENHRARDDVAWRKVDDCRRVALHEAFTVAVEQTAALAANGFGDENPSPARPVGWNW